MAIDTAGLSDAQYISWGALSTVASLSTRTYIAWIDLDGFTAGTTAIGGIYPQDGSGKFNSLVLVPSGSRAFFVVGWSTLAGQWRIDTGTGQQMIAFTYSNSATTNDPIGYLNGAAVTTTEAATPSGTYRSGSNYHLRLGGDSGGVEAIDGRTQAFLIYDRILTAAEISDIYNSRNPYHIRRGLVFAPQLHQRGEVGQGGTLTSGHTIADAVSGALGTPSGSPLFAQDAYLTFQG